MKIASARTVPVARLRVDRRFVIRDPLTDQERVQVLAAIYQQDGLAALPPIIVLDLGDGFLRVVDGMHRYVALKALKRPDALVAPLVTDGQMPIQAALDAAIEAAVVSPKNLTRDEQRALALRLVRERPALSRREVARKLGVSHTSINSWLNGQGATSDQSQEQTRDRSADRFVRALDDLLDRDDEDAAVAVASALARRYEDPAEPVDALMQLLDLVAMHVRAPPDD